MFGGAYPFILEHIGLRGQALKLTRSEILSLAVAML
jgi:hypothetical protein